MNVGLNAHLLASQAGYRTAGIHGYIYNTLAYLPQVTDTSWQFTALVGAKNLVSFEGVHSRRAAFDTESPKRRILWEQTLQPFQLHGFDLYHAMAFVSPVLMPPIPAVVTIYDLSFIHYPQVLSASRRAYLRALTALTVRRATRIITISESTARDVINVYNIDPALIDVAPPGTNFEQFKPLPQAEIDTFRQQRNLPRDFWLFLGTLEPRKNLPTLLRAYAMLPKDSRPALVLGGGKGWDYAEIFQTIEQHHLQDEVFTPGFLPVEDLPLWYNSASLFVYPSLYEGFGIPPLEAMACGTPVIVSNISSLPEVVGQSESLLVPPHDVQAWYDALCTALDDSVWRSRAREGGLQAARRYTWKNTAQQTVNSYRLATE